MTNREFVQSIGIELGKNVAENNAKVNQALNVETSEKFIKFVKDGERYKKVTLSPISFGIGFCEQVWSQCSIGEKLRLMKWASEDYLQSNGYGVDFPPFVYFEKNEYKDLSYSALAFDNKILLSLENIDKMSGYDAGAIAIHESVHLLDFVEINKLLDEEMSKYVFDYRGVNHFKTVKDIMKLPITGKIINWKTGQYEYVTPELAKNILRCKNKITVCSIYKGTPKSRKNVYSSADFDKYISACFYYASPIEQKAYNVSIKKTFDIAQSNSKVFDYSKNDVKALDNLYNYIMKINGKKREIQRQFQMPVEQAVNIELEHIFNKTYYSDKPAYYICQPHMQKREQMLNRFWTLKHSGKGEYVEGATQQIKGE